MIENHDFEFGNLNSAASCILNMRPLLDTEIRSQSRGFLRTYVIENYNFEVVNFSSAAFCIRADESRDQLQQTHRVSKQSVRFS